MTRLRQIQNRIAELEVELKKEKEKLIFRVVREGKEIRIAAFYEESNSDGTTDFEYRARNIDAEKENDYELREMATWIGRLLEDV